MPAPITLSLPLLIGLVVVSVLVGYLLARAAGNRRVQQAQDEAESRTRSLQADATARGREVESLRAESQKRETALAQAQTEIAELTAQLRITQAQLEELQAGAGETEDRLNAAEARILTADAEVAQSKADIAQWSAAYAQLKALHTRLTAEHGEAQERRSRLEEELKERRSELQEMSARLEALQQAQTLQREVRSADATDLQQTVAEVALARAEAEAVLRTRELELTEIRSQTASMRYSLNVLTASGAQLAKMLETQNVIDPDGAWLEPRPGAPEALFPLEMFRTPAAQAEELADLTGVIRDWFGDVEHRIPYDRHTMLLFAGLGYDDRFTQPALPSGAPATIDLEPESATEGEDVAAPRRTTARPAPELPPALMLAAIKAATTTALEHSATRQFEMARELADQRLRLEAMGERIQAWRTMLTLTLGDDPDTLRLLDDQAGADPLESLAACATVALTAYQKKKDALARAQNALPPPPPRATPALASRRR